MNPSSLPVLLRSLCLGEMARVLEALTEQAGRDGWSHEQYLRAMCDVEVGRHVTSSTCAHCATWRSAAALSDAGSGC